MHRKSLRPLTRIVRRGAASTWILLILIVGILVAGYHFYSNRQHKPTTNKRPKTQAVVVDADKEAAARKAKAAAEAKREKERLEKEEQERLERERKEQEERDRQEREREALKKEQERIERERKAKEAEEARLAKEKEEALRKELAAKKKAEEEKKRKYPYAVDYAPFKLTSLTRTPESSEKLLGFIDKIALRANPPYIGKATNGRAWANPEDIQKKITGRILIKLGKLQTFEADALKLINAPESRLEIAQWAFLNNADLSLFKKLANDPKKLPTVSAFMNDMRWLESMVYSGANKKTAECLEFLCELVAHDPEIVAKNMTPATLMKRRIATAVAAEFGRNGWYAKEPTDDKFILAKERYDYFSQSWKENALNPEFDNLQDWDLRVVCGWKGMNDQRFGEASTMRWLRENCALQESAYPDAACQVPYRLQNIFGDSIHGSDYYPPFDQLYAKNYAKEVRDVGSVCGGNAHFGATSACANGVPGITMGEPAHCAFAIRINGKWRPAFSVSWKHGCHWTVWDEHQWSFLNLTQDLFTQEFRTKLSSQLGYLGQVLGANGKPDQAVHLYEMATEIQPLNYPIWVNYAEELKKSAPTDAKKWKKLNDEACLGLSPVHPEVCTVLMKKHIYPTLLPLMKTDKDLTACFSSFIENLETPEADKWDLEEFLTSQINSLSTAESAVMGYFNEIFGKLMNKPAYAAQGLAWAQEYARALSPSVQKQVTALAMKSVGGSTMEGSDLDKLQAAALVGAENNKDIDTFQAIGQKYKVLCSGHLPEFEKFPGELLSSGGLLRCSSLSPQWDVPLKHWGVLEENGGFFHTNNENDVEWAEVILPKPSSLSGVVIVTTGQNYSRLKKWQVEISMNGEDWTIAQTLPDPCDQEVIRVDLKSKGSPQAKYVRIFREGKDFFSLRAILVYGKKNA